jgi:uncharacterized membrane protein YdcZ (DUF606 family)
MGAVWATIPFLLGALTVVQAGLNAKAAATLGLHRVVLINAITLLFCALLSYLIFGFKRATPDTPLSLSWTFALQVIVPGVIGYSIVIGGPWSVAQWGATRTFVLFVGAQLLAGVLWDYFDTGLPPPTLKIVGVVLTWLGVFVSIL